MIVQLYDLLFTVKCRKWPLYNCMNRYNVAIKQGPAYLCD